MLRVITDNTANAAIHHIDFNRVALNAEESWELAKEYPKEKILSVNENYRAYTIKSEELSESKRPILKKQHQGPFTLNIYNHGESEESSMIGFSVYINEEISKNENGIILGAKNNLVLRGLACLPLTQLFNKEIKKEVSKLKEFAKESKIVNLKERQAQRDAQLVRDMRGSIMGVIYDTPKNEEAEEILVGKTAVEKSLVSSLSASDDFYDTLWNGIQKTYKPYIDNIAKKVALGEISLSPRPQLHI